MTTNNKQIIWKAPFKRDGEFPLDRSFIFSTLVEADNYAKLIDQSKGIAYVGQVIAVTGDTVSVYKIVKTGEVGDNEANLERLDVLYNGSKTIEINDTDISVKVEATNEDNKNFIEVSNKGIAVKSIDANKTITANEITIEGGPLAEDVKSLFTDGKIPAGTNIEDILVKLLCKEIYPKPSKNNFKYTVNVNTTPSISVNSGVTNNSLVEVGQTISFNEVNANNVTISKTNPKVETFTNGYSETINGDIISATSVSCVWSVEQDEDEKTKFKLEATKTGFTGNLPTTSESLDYSECSLSSCELVAVEGENKYKVTQSGSQWLGTHTGITSKYVVSNLKNRSESEKSPAIPAQTQNVIKSPTAVTTTFKVIGVYPIFTNGVEAGYDSDNKPTGESISVPTEGVDGKLSLKNTGATFVVSYASQGIAPYTIYLPGEWKIKNAYTTNPLTGKLEADCKDNFKENGTKTFTVQGSEITYTVYEWNSTQGADYVKFTVE
jgi:hypothetical protein